MPRLPLSIAAMSLAFGVLTSAHAATCQLQVNASLPVSFIGASPVITVTINGQDEHMLLDSGSEYSYLSVHTYNALNLHDTATADAYTTGLGGNVQNNTFTMVDLNFGAVRYHDEVMFLAENVIPSKKGKALFDGIIGYDVLQRFDIGLDLPDHNITLYTPEQCATPILPWTGDYAPVPFTRPQGASPVIPVAINNQTLNAVLDTGAEVSLFMQASLSRSGVIPEAQPANASGSGLGLGNREFGLHMAKFSTVTIGAEQFSDDWLGVDVTKNRDLNANEDGFLGEDYFATHKVFIANSNYTAYLGLTGQ